MKRIYKICFGCQRLFEGRADAKTCSARCRKRFQRMARFRSKRGIGRPISI